MPRTALVVVALLLGDLAAGCSPRAEPKTDTRFDVNKGLLATIHHAERITLYEGLPHQFFERDILEQEQKSKQTVSFHGFAFYLASLEMKDDDCSKLALLLGNDRSFSPLPNFEKSAAATTRTIAWNGSSENASIVP